MKTPTPRSSSPGTPPKRLPPTSSRSARPVLPVRLVRRVGLFGLFGVFDFVGLVLIGLARFSWFVFWCVLFYV